MKRLKLKKVFALTIAAVLTVGSLSMVPISSVWAASAGIEANVSLGRNAATLKWKDTSADKDITGYRVYRTEVKMDGEAVPQEIATVDLTGDSCKEWNFDFGTTVDVSGQAVSYVQDDYIEVNKQNAFYTKEQGYGFTQNVPTEAGGSLDFVIGNVDMAINPLHGDFATLKAPEGGKLTAPGEVPAEGTSYMEFKVDLPNGTYQASATHSGYIAGRNISVFWFQGLMADRWAVNNNIATSSKTITIKDNILTVLAGASVSGGEPYAPGLSAVTVKEIKDIKTGIDTEGSFFCKDVTLDLDKAYTYKVVAMKGEQEAGTINSGDIQTIAAPTLSIKSSTTNSVTLEIMNNEVETDSYNIYRKKAGDSEFKVVKFEDINAEGNYTASKVLGEKEVYLFDDFNSYKAGDSNTSQIEVSGESVTVNNFQNLINADNGGWTVKSARQNYVAMVADADNVDSRKNTKFFNKTAIQNYDGQFAWLCPNLYNATFHKNLADAASLKEMTRLQFNFALPNWSNDGSKDRKVCDTYLYLADKELTQNDLETGYMAKLEFKEAENKLYLNDKEIFNFGTGTDKVRSIWNTITLDINPADSSISYELERETEDYLASGTVTIPQSAATAAEEGTDAPSYAVLSMTGSYVMNGTTENYWGNLALDNLKYAALGEVDSNGRTYTFTDTGLESNTDYSYKVKAVAEGAEFVESTLIAAKTQPVLAESVTLSKPSVELKKGQKSEKIIATVLPENASNKTVTWKSADTTIATVEDGVITGVKGGKTKITATTANGKEVSCDVTVTQVNLDKTRLSLLVGEEATLTATLLPSDLANKTVKWASDKESVAQVDENGTIKAVGKGTAVITVTADNNGETASCTVNVSKVAVESLKMSRNTATINAGTSVTLSADIIPENATVTEVKWSTSNQAVATVTNGVVKGVTRGSATITATSVDDETIKASCLVTVKVPSVKVTIQKPKSTVLNKGKQLTLKAVLSPTNSTDSVAWTSSNNKAATVSSKGVVKAVNKGTAKITAKSTSGKSAAITITVKVPATKVSMSPTKLTLKKGKSKVLKVKLAPSNSTDKVTWSTSNKKVATVKNGKVTAKKKGSATITAKAESGKSAKCKVTVK